MSGIVRAVHPSSTKLGDTPLARLDLFESLPSRRFGCRASTTNSTAKSRSTSLYRRLTSSRAGCRALQLYSALQFYSSTALYTLHLLHPPSDCRVTEVDSRWPHTLVSASSTVIVLELPGPRNRKPGPGGEALGRVLVGPSGTDAQIARGRSTRRTRETPCALSLILRIPSGHSMAGSAHGDQTPFSARARS